MEVLKVSSFFILYTVLEEEGVKAKLFIKHYAMKTRGEVEEQLHQS
jgi:hypothetical protein